MNELGSRWIVRVEYPNGEVDSVPVVSESHANSMVIILNRMNTVKAEAVELEPVT